MYVESLEHTVEQVLKLGSAVLRPKAAMPKTAWYAVIADPEENVFATWEPDPEARPLPESE